MKSGRLSGKGMDVGFKYEGENIVKNKDLPPDSFFGQIGGLYAGNRIS
jgi:hypothetical protein